MGEIERRLAALGLELPEPPQPAGSYVPWVRSGDLLFVSGQIPFDDDGGVIAGRVGVELTVEQGQAAARRCGLALVAVARLALGDLDRVERVVRVGGFVRCETGFGSQPQVINGCSELLQEIWGERGRHARAAVGVAGLPAQAAVEVDAVFEVRSG